MDLAQQLERFEGRVRWAYWDGSGKAVRPLVDVQGYATIGVGFLIDERKGGGLLDEEIDFILTNRIRLAKEAVLGALPWVASLNEPRQAVLFGMAYQMSLQGLLSFHHALDAARDERWADSAEALRQSKWAHEDSPARARTLALQMETGEWQ